MLDTVRRLRELEDFRDGYYQWDGVAYCSDEAKTAALHMLPLLLDIAEAAYDEVTANGRFPLNMPRLRDPGLSAEPLPPSTRLANALLALERSIDE